MDKKKKQNKNALYYGRQYYKNNIMYIISLRKTYL